MRLAAMLFALDVDETFRRTVKVLRILRCRNLIKKRLPWHTAIIPLDPRCRFAVPCHATCL